ncbi:hypothetical protein SDC9_95535 [bioreactor metagenome]|uniref:Uncharacterized protein n=1 Tax=bioreactor metagenome TaxID=1076179 RepID=A0A645A7Y4_9ZZZZ|nr:ABC transporter permease [Candidatus Metalachnospira sp.]
MGNLVYCEFLKLKRSKMLLISFLGALVTPAMIFADAVKIYFSHTDTVITLEDIFDDCSFYSVILFGVIVYTVIAAYLFSREHTEKTLKTMLTVPVSKNAFMLSKFVMLFIWIMALTLITWAGMYALAALYGAFFPLEEFYFSVALKYLGIMLFGGAVMFILCTPFVYLALRTKGIVVPIIASATVVMGNAALSNETIGALFPWTAVSMFMNGKIAESGYPLWVSVLIVVFIAVVGFALSMIYFNKEDVK